MSSEKTDRRSFLKQTGTSPGIDRRTFLKGTGAVVAVLGSGFSIVGGFACSSKTEGKGRPASEGYILVDTKKCQGCLSCMIFCSLIHEGEANLSLARLQIMQNSFACWPDDVGIEACRQCEQPACVEACPAGALSADPEHGNVRRVDENECIGCGVCVRACPYTPSRSVVAPDADHDGQAKSRKCDLCAEAKHHWDECGGGPAGMQACAEVCPVGAIAFTAVMPAQDGDDGYKLNLRGTDWADLGYPIED